MIKLLLLFTLVPLAELWLLIEVGRLIGSGPTIVVVASTGFAGVLLARSQGLSILYQMQRDLEHGILPGEQIFDGVCILLGGAFLLTPGLVTDLLGFSLLIPLTRGWIKRAVQRYLRRKIDEGTLDLRWRW